MAFENVFGNVDFGAPQRQRNLEQQQFAQMLGMGMQAAQNAADYELKERQMEAKANEVNLKRDAETALLKRNMGFELTPQEQAYIDTMAQIAPPTFTTDASGRLIQQPSGWGNVGGQIPQGANSLFPPNQTRDGTTTGFSSAAQPYLDQGLSGGQGYSMDGLNIPPVDLYSMDNRSPAPDGMPLNVGMVQGEDGMIYPDDEAILQPSEYFMQSPKTQQAIAEMSAEEAFQREKERREIKKNLPQEVLAIESSFQEAKNMNDIIKKVYDKANVLNTGFVAQKTQGVGGSPAHNLQELMKPILSDAGLSKLIEVKERGGTFGALQEKELDLLIANRAALSQTQSLDQFKEQLASYQQQRMKTMNLMADFFQNKYGYVPEGLMKGIDKNIIDPRIEAAKSGKVFTNAQGEKIKLVNGKWQKI